ncbi:MAG: hypothetical protein ACON35_05360 [Candidatus Marinamargulisbacteria bacterium]
MNVRNNPFSGISHSNSRGPQFENPFGQRANNTFASGVNQAFSSNCFKVTTPDDNNSQWGTFGGEQVLIEIDHSSEQSQNIVDEGGFGFVNNDDEIIGGFGSEDNRFP